MDVDILPPCDDRIFKKILTAPDAMPALINLVSAVTMRPVIKVTVRNNEIPPSDTDEKAERLDINCVTDDGSQLDIEMQASHIAEQETGEPRNLKGKSIYYLCDLHSSQSSKSKAYDQLARSYQITFCKYTVFPHREDFINSYSLRHDIDNELLSDALKVIYVELSKLNEILKKPVDVMTDLEKWAVFLRYAESPDYRKVVNQVIESKEALNVAGEILMSISKDERERAIFRSRRMYQSDMESDRITNQNIGRKAEKFDIATRMLKRNRPIVEIVEDTGLTREEIETLR
jgi:predicted transposase/invertase (TIGR01784 family)